MRIVKLGIVIGLLALICGGVSSFYYVAFWKSHYLAIKEEKNSERSSCVVPSATPDYTLEAFDKAMSLVKGGNIPEGNQALRDFIATYPQSSKISEAKKTAGELNTSEFFSLAPSRDKTSYTVVSGDSLIRIANHFKTNPELIFKINNLPNIKLRIGQKLIIPQPEISMSINREKQTLTLVNRGHFFKEYPILSFKASHLPAHGAIASKIIDKFSMQGSKRIGFGDTEYPQSERYILLSQANLMIRAAPRDVTEDHMPAGIVLAPPDVEEIFLMASRGTPIIIQ